MEGEQRIIIKLFIKESLYVKPILVQLQTHVGEKAYARRTRRFWIEDVSSDHGDVSRKQWAVTIEH
jgi:hypothetical protein